MIRFWPLGFKGIVRLERKGKGRGKNGYRPTVGHDSKGDEEASCFKVESRHYSTVKMYIYLHSESLLAIQQLPTFNTPTRLFAVYLSRLLP